MLQVSLVLRADKTENKGITCAVLASQHTGTYIGLVYDQVVLNHAEAL